MKNSIRLATVSGLFLLAVPFSAYAACPDGQFEYYTQGTDADGNAIAVQQCRITANRGRTVAVTGDPSYHLTPALDADGKPISIDGHPIMDGTVNDWRAHQHDNPTVYGIQGVALGNGAKVGAWAPGSCTSGTLDGGVCKDADGKAIEGAYVEPHPVSVNYGTAIGAGASVQHDYSTAIGARATSTADHQVTLGTKAETISAPGITSDLSKSRQVGPLELVTTDANGNLASDGGKTFQTLADHGAAIDGLTRSVAAQGVQISHLNDKMKGAYAGIAMATAYEAPQVDQNHKFGLAVNWGHFEDMNALSAVGKFRVNDNWAVTAGFATADSKFSAKAGIHTQW
jgi:hypothetical protein